MSRLSVQLDGEPVFLYKFAYEDERRYPRGGIRTRRRCRNYLCAHCERMTPEEVRARFVAAVKLLPEEIDYDYMEESRALDLFEQAIALAGFTVVDDELEGGLWLRGAHPAVTERRTLERALERD